MYASARTLILPTAADNYQRAGLGSACPAGVGQAAAFSAGRDQLLIEAGRDSIIRRALRPGRAPTTSSP
jgi:hypothetical protein